MASFVNQAVLNAVQAKKEDRFARKQYTAEEIKAATDLALKVGITEAADRTGIKSSSIFTWKKFYVDNQQQYFVPVLCAKGANSSGST